MDTAATPSPRQCARHIVEAFARYNAEFRAVTRRAPQRFDARDWKGSQRDAVERIELYDGFVNQTIAALRLALGSDAANRSLWQRLGRLVGGPCVFHRAHCWYVPFLVWLAHPGESIAHDLGAVYGSERLQAGEQMPDGFHHMIYFAQNREARTGKDLCRY